MEVGPRDAVIDFLQQHDIGGVVLDDGHDSLGPIAPIDAADALVDVVGEDTKPHIPMIGMRRRESSGSQRCGR